MKINDPNLPDYLSSVWVQSYGQDQYGVWQGVVIAGEEVRFRWIPPGEFMMGSPQDEADRYDNEEPQHRVEFKQGCWLAETTCTQALWQAVMGENPSRFKDNPQNPVENVSWSMTQDFIQRINQQTPALALRLPSEAEWEYVCRAGTKTRYAFGDEITHEQANFNEKKQSTVPVKSYQPNVWGLYQMHGNVWEWCQDKWHDDYQGAPADGQAWETGDSEDQLCRGGSWIGDGKDLRSAYRINGWLAVGSCGLRLAGSSDEP